MKNKFLIVSMLFACSIIFAQNSKSKTVAKPVKKATVKPVAKAPVSLVDGDAVKYPDNYKIEEFTGTGKDILISGNNNKLTIKGTVGKILITGKDNDVALSSVSQIIITGSNNFVSWETSQNTSGKPVVQDKGGYNNVGKKSGNALNNSDN